jgi:apolipoprotein N-acyltransferase
LNSIPLAFLAGAATVLAFAPIGFYPLALLSFGVLVHLWAKASARECFWTGFAFGMGLFGAGVSWVFVSLHTFGGMPAPVAIVATLGFCALIALFPAGAGWLQARVPAHAYVRACLVVPASWTLFEWLRSWVLTGFPWLSAGYAAVGWPAEGLASSAGVFGVSFATLCMAGLAWVAASGKRKVLPVAAIIAVLAGSEALRGVEWTEPSGKPVVAALLQGNIEQDLKFRPERYERILLTYYRLAEESRASLIVLPETAVPRLLDRVDPAYVARLEGIARRNGGALLLGVPIQDRQGNYYNSVVSIGTRPQQIYRKRHLVPFGEFVPPAFGWVMDLLRIPMSDFSRGAADQAPIRAAGQKIAVNVCYEDAFGDAIAEGALDASLLVNVSNVAWFGDSLAPSQHLQMAQMRAIETGRMHLTATNTGVTAAIDRDGKVLAQLPPYTEGRLEIAVQGYSGTTPYMRWRDWPALAVSLLVLAAATLAARLRKRPRG